MFDYLALNTEAAQNIWKQPPQHSFITQKYKQNSGVVHSLLSYLFTCTQVTSAWDLCFAGVTIVYRKASESRTMFDGCCPGSRLATFIYCACVSHRGCSISAGEVPHFYIVRVLIIPPLIVLLAIVISHAVINMWSYHIVSDSFFL
jgi:hypothetical protein